MKITIQKIKKILIKYKVTRQKIINYQNLIL